MTYRISFALCPSAISNSCHLCCFLGLIWMLRCSSCNHFQYILSVCVSLAADQCLYVCIWGIKIQGQAANRGTLECQSWKPVLVTKDSTKRLRGLQIISTIKLPLGLTWGSLQGLSWWSLCPISLCCRHWLWKERWFCAAVHLLTKGLPRPGDVRYSCCLKSCHHLHSVASFRLPRHTVVGALHSGDTLVLLMAQKLLWCLLQCSRSGHIIRKSHTSS